MEDFFELKKGILKNHSQRYADDYEQK